MNNSTPSARSAESTGLERYEHRETIVEETLYFTLPELCRASGASEQQLFAWVDEGALTPEGRLRDDRQDWRFGGTALRRARTAAHLARDLEINPSGIALALDLLEQLDSLRARLR